MKKIFLVFLMSVGLVFGGEDLEYLSSLFSTMTGQKVKIDNKRDVVSFYIAFIKPIRINDFLNAYFTKIGDKSKVDFLKPTVFTLEMEYLKQVKNIFSDYSSNTQLSLAEADEAINIAIKDANNNYEKEAEDLRKLKDSDWISFIVNYHIAELIRDENLNNFLSHCSNNAKALADDKDTIPFIIVFYFIKDAMQKTPKEIKIANRELIEKQLNEILKSKGVEADTMIKTHYDTYMELFEDFIKKINVLKEMR